MPIERREFESGETHDAVEARIERFLAEHPDSAYSAEEIAVAIGHPAGRSPPGVNEIQSAYRWFQHLAFVSLLDVMAHGRKIDRRTVRTERGPESFYAARRPA